jgi:K+-transporting ATPase KdpF subunit
LDQAKAFDIRRGKAYGHNLVTARTPVLFADRRTFGRMRAVVSRGKDMSAMYLIGIVVTVLMFGYLVYALIKAEKF